MNQGFKACISSPEGSHSAPLNELILFEDEHLLVANKPAGWNTHAPAPYAGEGLYDWLRHREPRWAGLAIIHRLDKETSGVIVFSKTALANRSLTHQFTERAVRKTYVLLTDKPVSSRQSTVVSTLKKVGDHYASQPFRAGAERAETRFHVASSQAGQTRLSAEPLTGRTHQIRVHAASSGFPVLGDTLYGGSPAPRVCLHAASIEFQHPASGNLVKFEAGCDFSANTRGQFRMAVIDINETNAYRLIHGAADGSPGWYVDRLGAFLLSQSDTDLTASQMATLREIQTKLGIRGAYHKVLTRHVRQSKTPDVSPVLVLGEEAPDEFLIRENGLNFLLSFREGYSVGLFLDQRDNRRRFITGHVAAGFPLFQNPTQECEVLNTFAYTCGFSVCAARSGAQVTSLDLSPKYLEWGRRNFTLNDLDPAGHDFIYGDTFDWLKRFAKKKRLFDAVILDPPTFSQSREYGVFRVERDYGRLVASALNVLRPGGTLLASTNAAKIDPENFVRTVSEAVSTSGRKIGQKHYVPQPPDFPITRSEPGYLKTLWLRIE